MVGEPETATNIFVLVMLLTKILFITERVITLINSVQSEIQKSNFTNFTRVKS